MNRMKNLSLMLGISSSKMITRKLWNMEVDFKTQVMTLNGPVNVSHSNSAV